MRADMKKYTIEITETQVNVIKEALEVFARLGIGQFRDALESLPLKESCAEGRSDDMLVIGQILKKHTKSNVDGWQSSFSIHSQDVNDEAQIAWDIYQVIRRKLSWDYAIENGWVKDENDTRNWKEMMGVNLDDPLQVGPDPLAKITAVDGLEA
jgi:hypothetical protein